MVPGGEVVHRAGEEEGDRAAQREPREGDHPPQEGAAGSSGRTTGAGRGAEVCHDVLLFRGRGLLEVVARDPGGEQVVGVLGQVVSHEGVEELLVAAGRAWASATS